MDKPLRAIPVMIGLGIVLAVAHNLIRNDPLPWRTEARAAVNLDALETGGAAGDSADTAAAVDPNLGIPESEFPITISLEKAKKLHDTGIPFYDARDSEEYGEGHIAGAVLASYDEVGGDPEWLETTAKTAGPIVVYCGGGECELSLNLGFAVAQAGHRRVLVFEEGYAAWDEAGYPTRTGEEP